MSDFRELREQVEKLSAEQLDELKHELNTKNVIERVEADVNGNMTVWFFGSSEPWDVSEFAVGSATRKRLERIRELLFGE